jgi:hypothetical protein
MIIKGGDTGGGPVSSVSQSVDVSIDGSIPAIVDEVDYEHEGEISSITTTCGETENRREADRNPTLTITGWVSELEMESIKSLDKGEEVRVVTDVHTKDMVVKKVNITQKSGDVGIHIGNVAYLIFKFQVILRQKLEDG